MEWIKALLVRLRRAVRAELVATAAWMWGCVPLLGHAVTRAIRWLWAWSTSTDDACRSQRRVVLFLLAVALMLLVARAGTSMLLFGASFAVFAVASTVWVRGQYEDFVLGRRHVTQRRVIGGLFVAASAMVLTYFLGIPGLGLPAVVLSYFALGALITRWRATASERGVAGVHGLALALGAVVLLVPGFLLAGEGGRGQVLAGLVLMAVALLVLWPLAVSLLSERLINAFDRERERWVVWVGMLGGLLVYVVVVAANTSSPPMMVFLLIFGVVTVAAASSTQAEIVLGVALLALLGVTPRQEEPPAAMTELEGREHVLVALGDSYMSGEGAEIYYEGTDNAGENGCRRAPTAWAALAGQQPPFDGVMFLACSGAKSNNIRSLPTNDRPPATQQGEPGPQLAQYLARKADEDFDVEMVVISIGGNDAGFSTLGITCLVPGDCSDPEVSTLWTGGLKSVDYSLRKTFAEVRDVFPETPVVVTAYPDPIYHGAEDPSGLEGDEGVKRCDDVVLSSQDQEFIAVFLARLNDTVYAAANDYGFHYLDEMQHSLADANMQLCDPDNNGRPGLNFIGLRSVSGFAEQRFSPANWSHNSLHPNERGHTAMFRTFEQWYAENAPLAPPEAVEEPPDDTAGPPSYTVGCDPLDPTDRGCRRQGTTWALGKLGDGIWGWPAVETATAAAAIWLAAVALFGWRRREYRARAARR